ncbi:MAG: sulfite exporter TauE/SafE family protein [Sciscionella sp.]
MDFSLPLVVAGALVGVSVGLTGMGGGALMTPILVLIFGVSPGAAVGSDLLASVAMKPFAAVVHHRAGTVRWELVRVLVPTAVPAGFAGAFVLHLFGNGDAPQHRIKLAIGLALLLAVAGMAARAVLVKRRGLGEAPAGEPVAVRRVPTMLVGLVGGLIVGMTSVGSGSLIIVMLMLIHPRLRTNDLVGTDLVQAIPLVAAAALGHLVLGDTQLALTGFLLLGAIPGVLLGAVAATHAPSGLLRWMLAILLLGSGLKLWHTPTSLTLLACAALVVAGLGSLVARRTAPRADQPAFPSTATRQEATTRQEPTVAGQLHY